MKQLLIFFVAALSLSGQIRYPEHWWAPVSEANKPDWEILPQAAKPPEVILSKRHELGTLSNFAPTPFTLRGVRYASVEGFWQMMLYPEGPTDPRARLPGVEWPHTRTEVGQMTAFEAKGAGDFAYGAMKKANIDWVSFEGKRFPYWSPKKGEHYKLILQAMRAKLEQNPEVRRILLSTGDLVLRPDHYQEENAPPEWRYFRIWMEQTAVSERRLVEILAQESAYPGRRRLRRRWAAEKFGITIPMQEDVAP